MFVLGSCPCNVNQIKSASRLWLDCEQLTLGQNGKHMEMCKEKLYFLSFLLSRRGIWTFLWTGSYLQRWVVFQLSWAMSSGETWWCHIPIPCKLWVFFRELQNSGGFFFSVFLADWYFLWVQDASQSISSLLFFLVMTVFIIIIHRGPTFLFWRTVGMLQKNSVFLMLLLTVAWETGEDNFFNMWLPFLCLMAFNLLFYKTWYFFIALLRVNVTFKSSPYFCRDIEITLQVELCMQKYIPNNRRKTRYVIIVYPSFLLFCSQARGCKTSPEQIQWR